MKRTALIILALVVLVLLTACQKKVATYTITMQDGTPYTVNTSAKTVFDGMYTYAYEFYGNSENYTLTLTYPDSSTYSYRMQAGALVGYGVHLAVYLVYHQAFTIIQRVNNGIRQLEIFHRSFRLVAFKWE